MAAEAPTLLDERVLRVEDEVWYYGGLTQLRRPAVGELVASTRRLTFFEKMPRAGLPVWGNPTLETVAMRWVVEWTRVVGTKVERRFRGKWSRPEWRNLSRYRAILSGRRRINVPPTFIDAREEYDVLLVAIHTDTQLESMSLEVKAPLTWIETLRRVGVAGLPGV